MRQLLDLNSLIAYYMPQLPDGVKLGMPRVHATLLLLACMVLHNF